MKRNGRPPIDGISRETKVFTRISEKEAKEIEELANYLDIPKSVFMRNLVLVALDDAKLLKKLGILGLAKGIKKTSEAVSKLKEIRPQAQVAI